MPAVIRGSAKAGRTGARGPARGGARQARATYAPSKLNASSAVRMDPRMAVWLAAGGVGLAFLVVVGAGGGVRAAQQGVAGLVDQTGVAMGFRLNHLTIKGLDAAATPSVAQASALNPGDAILGVNLDRLRERVEQVGWVKSAQVLRRLPDTIEVTVRPRPLLAVWQHGGSTNVIDGEGVVIPEAAAGGFPDLPLIAGEGANETAAQILPLVAARPRLMARLDGLQRIDGRRWRLKLKDGGIIDLPAKGEDGALILFDRLDARSHLLDLGFDRIDLRDPDATDVRLKGAGAGVNEAALGGAQPGL